MHDRLVNEVAMVERHARFIGRALARRTRSAAPWGGAFLSRLIRGRFLQERAACPPALSRRRRAGIQCCMTKVMSEMGVRCRVWTVDRADFSVYRRNGKLAIPCEFPPG